MTVTDLSRVVRGESDSSDGSYSHIASSAGAWPQGGAVRGSVAESSTSGGASEAHYRGPRGLARRQRRERHRHAREYVMAVRVRAVDAVLCRRDGEKFVEYALEVTAVLVPAGEAKAWDGVGPQSTAPPLPRDDSRLLMSRVSRFESSGSEHSDSAPAHSRGEKGQRWLVWRRYNHFKALDASLRRSVGGAFPENSGAVLPSGAFYLDPLGIDTVVERTRAWPGYIAALLSCPQTAAHPALIDFLELRRARPGARRPRQSKGASGVCVGGLGVAKAHGGAGVLGEPRLKLHRLTGSAARSQTGSRTSADALSLSCAFGACASSPTSVLSAGALGMAHAAGLSKSPGTRSDGTLSIDDPMRRSFGSDSSVVR